MSGNKSIEQRSLISVIGDDDTVTGLLLAGTGQVNEEGKKNFYIVNQKTTDEQIASVFDDYTTKRSDIAIVLINQVAANRIRDRIDKYVQAFPAVLEIPSKDDPYDPEKDSILRRVRKIVGE
ncbi:V-type ATPase V1 subunit F [Schizosaccharomyces osmophilus]|uniref:V-type proton ATPase subunit F n=1 Tax=Schizosaccharomyces osmophilus TaxID=2545709 RepID=A0AAE9W5D3_9SCHI|nr:V-type ATPase V1 subunit F [Schizosaccharomyces osmophilus]WBW70545.1 V-type ATPase V1 subunit F [Schizosaccharomyces osmophilus]